MGLVHTAEETAFTEFRIGFPYPITLEGEKGGVGEGTESIIKYFYNSIKRYHLWSTLAANIPVIKFGTQLDRVRSCPSIGTKFSFTRNACDPPLDNLTIFFFLVSLHYWPFQPFLMLLPFWCLLHWCGNLMSLKVAYLPSKLRSRGK